MKPTSNKFRTALADALDYRRLKIVSLGDIPPGVSTSIPSHAIMIQGTWYFIQETWVPGHEPIYGEDIDLGC